MLPVASGTRGSSPDLFQVGLAPPPGNAKDILLLHEEDAEEWALYLREIFMHVVEREAILLYPLHSFSSSHLEVLNLNVYKCKLLILSNSLLKDLTSKKCQFLEKVLHSRGSVVTLLCGMESSDPFYQLFSIPRRRWEISTEQEPDDYLSVIRQILDQGPEDYLEVNIPTDSRAKYPEDTSGQEESDNVATLGPSVPQVLVLPGEIPCENPGEIFILLKDELIGEILEVEFISTSKRLRTRPAHWNKSVWHMKAADFPAGSVTVNIHCDGIIKATTEIKYCSAAKATESPFRVSDTGKNLCQQKNMEELDTVLTSIFKCEIPHYEFKHLQTETSLQKENTHTTELPTLLHCAAKFGLKNLALHLLQCAGAAWAARIQSTDGSDLLHIAESHGHEEVKDIFEDFLSQNTGRNNEEENDYEEDVISISTYSPSMQSPASHHELGKTHRQSTDRSEEPERSVDTTEEEARAEASPVLPEVDRESSENQYDDLYVFIPGFDTEGNSEEPLPHCRPPLPPPRPGAAAACQLERPHFTSQVFQQKAARRQSDGDKFYSLPKKPDKTRMESPTFPSTRDYLTTGQDELILLQERVKNGKMSVDEALEKFKHWQMGKSGLEMIQQEKLRQLRDNIIGKRPEDENAYDKLTIVHHTSSNTAHNENMLYNSPFNSKFPAPIQVEKEFGFCFKKDH
ncbi:B-cell scaffold protein with ankyrin repeats isoform X5 [Apodemus sylvaticus]|uniref:B-cell scaffold protein with ankyrin repeats isoform X5 n=1 Tax=Apodemus sylvaticus TaxID=10129 RepID=UPI00224347A1|nr:B-cell scaffold protein with ankyrin repeats isoform X5 [Apodemus sylvaticus]